VQAALRVGQTQYIKPLQTGANAGLEATADEFTIRARVADLPSTRHLMHERLETNTLFCWPEPRSPHEAAAMATAVTGDEIPDTQQVVYKLVNTVVQSASQVPESQDPGVSIIETAGGVLSPGATGEPQGDMYAGLASYLNDPRVMLAGDARLGGIAVTLASIESLWHRGYSVPVVAFVEETEYDNASFVRDWANDPTRFSPMPPRGSEHVQVMSFPPLPPPGEPLTTWYSNNENLFDDLLATMTAQANG
jgi:dethiobiotin synthetase